MLGGQLLRRVSRQRRALVGHAGRCLPREFKLSLNFAFSFYASLTSLK
jgi:hypothetical protein